MWPFSWISRYREKRIAGKLGAEQLGREREEDRVVEEFHRHEPKLQTKPWWELLPRDRMPQRVYLDAHEAGVSLDSNIGLVGKTYIMGAPSEAGEGESK